MTGKYAPLEVFLRELPITKKEIRLSFEEIEGIIHGKLPSSAYGYQQWWEHETEGNHIHKRAWDNAGWKIDTLNLNEKWVRLVRAK